MVPSGGSAGSAPRPLIDDDVNMQDARQDKGVRLAGEMDHLLRNSKKSKIDLQESNLGSVDVVMDTPPEKQIALVDSLRGFDMGLHEEPMDNNEAVAAGSMATNSNEPRSNFRDSLIGVDGGRAYKNEFVNDLVSDDDEPDEEEDEECPVIRAAKAEKIEMRRLWRQTLIIKVMGRIVGYSYLL